MSASCPLPARERESLAFYLNLMTNFCQPSIVCLSAGTVQQSAISQNAEPLYRSVHAPPAPGLSERCY